MNPSSTQQQRLYSADNQLNVWDDLDDSEDEYVNDQAYDVGHHEAPVGNNEDLFEVIGEEEPLVFSSDVEYEHLLSQREFGGEEVAATRLGLFASHSLLQAESVLLRERAQFPDMTEVTNTFIIRSPSTPGDIYSVLDRMEYQAGLLVLALAAVPIRRAKIAELKRQLKKQKQSVKPLQHQAEFPLRIDLSYAREGAVLSGHVQRYQYLPKETCFHIKTLFSGEIALQWTVRTLHALQVLHSSLKQGGHISKRDLFYSLTRVFGTQTASDSTLMQLQSQQVCPRHILGFHAAVRTLAYGPVQIHVLEETAQVCREYPAHVEAEWRIGVLVEGQDVRWEEERQHPIPQRIVKRKRHLLGTLHFMHPRGVPDVSPHCVTQQVSLQQAQRWVSSLQPSRLQAQEWFEQQSVQHEVAFTGRAVLIVEKDTVFEMLRQQTWFPHGDVLLVTARGYPNVSARLFLLQIHHQHPRIPFLVQVDPDVDGYNIFLQYQYGSPNQVLDASGALPIQLIGAAQEDILLMQLRGLPLSSRDKKTAKKLIKQCNTVQNTVISSQLQQLLAADHKVELEQIPDLPLYIRSLLQRHIT